ncbi:GNAT family N-acetyltransferase [Arthrobacter sp. HMWF013]|uniref:GNAT family N-acetyltransferase n=1 Tax=Arthrobacter sp. HMWF013 TaxID=2056849 RepID=UPI000D375B51|nr:GNAT family N-acetyltransferase [Arthrobacter sp. HMWF013]PTT70756.1 GNAT family N-acetyltransferase [Arthrobacter sp. HMWF013]
MSPSPEPASAKVRLADIDEHLLAYLVELALRDASPDDVTPPLGMAAGWTDERIAWFRAYHRSAAAGLDGPAREKSWAVLYEGIPAGCIRLKRVQDSTAQHVGAQHSEAGHATAETGIWLGRGYRGRGVGSAALALVLAEACRAGLQQVVAHTTAGNTGAQRILTSAGAALTHDDDGAVSAVVVLSP